MRRSELEEAEGYRQSSTKAIQGPSCHAIGTCFIRLLRVEEQVDVMCCDPSNPRRGCTLGPGKEFDLVMSLSLTYMDLLQIGYGSNKKTRHLMPSGHKAFLVNNPADVDLLLMHNKTFAAEYVFPYRTTTAVIDIPVG